MTWNYRMVLHDHAPNPDHHWIGLHSVYYEEDDTLIGWNADPEEFVAKEPESIIALLERAIRTLQDPRFSPILRRSELEIAPTDTAEIIGLRPSGVSLELGTSDDD